MAKKMKRSTRITIISTSFALLLAAIMFAAGFHWLVVLFFASVFGAGGHRGMMRAAATKKLVDRNDS